MFNILIPRNLKSFTDIETVLDAQGLLYPYYKHTMQDLVVGTNMMDHPGTLIHCMRWSREGDTGFTAHPLVEMIGRFHTYKRTVWVWGIGQTGNQKLS
jgi:hypothetical protein